MSHSETSTVIEAHPLSELRPPPSVHGKDGEAASKVESLVVYDLSGDTASARPMVNPSKTTSAVVLTTVVCVTMISTLLAGLVTVGLPTMAADLHIPQNLLLWPISVYALACGCTLLLLGSVADVVGSRPMYLTGCVLQSVFTLACGLAQTPMQMIVFRALAGVAISFCLPSAVSIITSTFPEGRSRNTAFASMGGGQPIGFSSGLIIGGVLTKTIGWRWGFHIAAIVNSIVFVVGFFGLPKADEQHAGIFKRLKKEIDWVGIGLGSVCVALLSYSYSLVSESTDSIKDPLPLSMLIVSIALIPAFIFWVGRQEKLGRPAVIPNSLWRNRIFTTICIAVFLTWGIFNALETYLTLFFQEVQRVNPMQAAVRFLPTPIVGALVNIFMGMYSHRIRADYTLIFGSVLTCVAALLFCMIQPQWIYWACAFPVVALNPIGADTLFTISNLVITSVFPERTQGLAGGVFNTISQLGKSVGLATSGVIATSVTDGSRFEYKESPAALMEGYRAALWFNFACSALTVLLLGWGLKGIGKVGVKRE